MKLGYRNTRCHWGTHIACLYQSEEEKDRFLHGFMCRGLNDGDYLLYGLSHERVENFKSRMVAACPEFRLHIQDPERINIVKAGELFTSRGAFSTIGMDCTIRDLYKRQHSEHHRNLRIATEMSWALNSAHPVDELEAFEAEMNLIVPEKNIVAVCLYDLNLFSTEMILRVLGTHPYTISRGIMTHSSYYEPRTHYMNLTGPDSFAYGHATGF